MVGHAFSLPAGRKAGLHPDGFSNLLGWAFRPRNFMKATVRGAGNFACGHAFSGSRRLQGGLVFRPGQLPRLPAPYRVDSRGTRIGSINTVLAGRLRLELMDLISMSAACCPMAVLLWSMVESGTRNRSE